MNDRELLERLKGCLADERKALGEFLRLLMEVDHRRVYAKEGHPSLYTFLTAQLKLSEDTAYRRIQVARAGKAFPALLEAVEAGAIHLTGASILAPVPTQENHEKLILQARHRSRKEIESLISNLSGELVQAPKDFIRNLPLRVQVEPKSTWIDQGRLTNSVTPTSTPAAPPEPAVTIQRKVSIHFVADQEFLKCLQRARELLRPKFPEGRLEDVFHEALRLYLDKKDPAQKYSNAPTQPLPAPREGRFIPSSVKAAVWKRDNGRCTYTTKEGLRCEARSGLEFDHIIPFAKGGLSIARNLRLLCRTHNQLEARREYGEKFIERKVPS